ncbi:SDR family oxidoreductase [Corynebacterium sputi]|uniref:SDR family oxidoreductase n=1 Tax=Corynebacterium sputi TaxID=489915 RepID=UPI00040D4ACD|nr:SDR family oxidoreductase [Corynebacterium sputi]
MSRVIVIGANGKVAQRLLPILTDSGHQVRGVIRNPDRAEDVQSFGATAEVADVEHLSTEEITALLDGSDTVVWSAGAGAESAEKTYAIDRDAAIRTMDAAAAAGAKRFIMVSYLGSGVIPDVPEDNWLYSYSRAKTAADEHLRNTDLDWTILAPGPLTLDEPTGLISITAPGDGRIPRGDVAAVVATVIGANNTIGQRLPLGEGDTRIADAIQTYRG